MSGRAGNAGQITLPDGWRKAKKSGRPEYRRRDGYVVKLDNPASWGVRAPGEQVPFSSGHPERDAAIARVDAEYPLAPDEREGD